MHHYRAKYLLFLLSLVVCVKASAQTSTVSNPLSERENAPYSQYGVGELWNGNNAALMGMGNITSAFTSVYEVNSDNPASYSFLGLTTYELGMTASYRTVATNTASYGTGTVSLAYLNIGIPIPVHNKDFAFGLSFGLRPYTHMYYSMDDTIATAIGRTARYYSGQGAMNFGYIGVAARYKGLSLGANVGYMFGDLRNSTSVVDIDDSIRAYDAEFSKYNKIGGLYWKGGALYQADLNKDYSINIGATITLQQSLNVTQNTYNIGSFNYGDTLVQDTTLNSSTKEGKLTMPMSYSFGVLLSHQSNWSVGIDYSATQWSHFRNSVDSTMSLGVGNQSYKLSVGGEYTPNPTSIRNYLAKVTYRLGFYYGTDFVNLQSTSLPVYGITFGGSLPFKRTTSRIHAAFDIGRLGTKTNGLIQQTYVRFTLGVSFNDRWFRKKAYD